MCERRVYPKTLTPQTHVRTKLKLRVQGGGLPIVRMKEYNMPLPL